MSRLEEAFQRAAQQQAAPDDTMAAENALVAEEVAAVGLAVQPDDTVPVPWQFDVGERMSDAEPAPDEERAPEPAHAAETQGSGSDRPQEQPWSAFSFGLLASHKVVVDTDADSSLVEQFRRLAAVLHHAQLQRGIRTLMISSAVASEGKTLTATNLSLTLSHSYRRRVLLIDADLRRPTVHEVFRIGNDFGLGDILRNPDARQVPLRQLSPLLWVLTAGKPDPDPMGGLVSRQMKGLLVDAADHFDWVIVDTPPVALLSDANLLAAPIDAALIVIGANGTPYPLVRRAIESIGPDRVIGVVLNRIDKSELVGGYGYYDYYGYSYGRSKKPMSGKEAPQPS